MSLYPLHLHLSRQRRAMGDSTRSNQGSTGNQRAMGKQRAMRHRQGALRHRQGALRHNRVMRLRHNRVMRLRHNRVMRLRHNRVMRNQGATGNQGAMGERFLRPLHVRPLRVDISTQRGTLWAWGQVGASNGSWRSPPCVSSS